MPGNGRATIMYVGGFELPDRNAAALRVLSNARILRRIGYEVVLVGMSTLVADAVHHDASDGEFDTWDLPYPHGALAWAKHMISARPVMIIARAYQATLRAIICYNFPAFPLFALRRICRASGVRLIGDATEWYSSRYGSPFFRVAKFMDTFLRMRIAHFRIDGLITVSSFLYRFYDNRRRPVVRIPVLFDTEELSAHGAVASRARSDEKLLIYAGNPFPSRTRGGKGFVKDRIDRALLILAVLRARGVRFVFHIWGVTAGEYLDVYPEQASVIHGLGDSVVFQGRGTHGQILAFLRECDFSLFLRVVDRATTAGFPTKLAESISHGVPVITNLTSDIAEYVTQGSTGFVIDEGTIEEQASQMRTILSMGRNECDDLKARCSLAGVFSLDRYVEPFRDFMERTLDGNHGPARGARRP